MRRWIVATAIALLFFGLVQALFSGASTADVTNIAADQSKIWM